MREEARSQKSEASFREQVQALHPDFNGGDASRVAEFTSLMREHRKPRCRCGCGEILKRAGRRHFIDRFHWLRWRYQQNPQLT